MPMAYGGGITTLEQIRTVFSLGFEKVIINSAAYDDPDLVREAVSVYGAQSVVGCIDVRRGYFGRYSLFSHSGRTRRKTGLLEHIDALSDMGIGELLVNSIHRDGTQKGYDIELLKTVTERTTIPVIACGGAGGIEDFSAAVQEGGASAVAAGSLFVFVGPHRAVLINYPDRRLLESRLP